MNYISHLENSIPFEIEFKTKKKKHSGLGGEHVLDCTKVDESRKLAARNLWRIVKMDNTKQTNRETKIESAPIIRIKEKKLNVRREKTEKKGKK